MRAIVIDAKKREVREEEFDPAKGLEFLQKCVGGYIERGRELRNGDSVFVNEEGLLEGLDFGFYIEGAHQPFVGSGVVVNHDEDGETIAAKSPLTMIKAMVQFFGVQNEVS